MILAFGGKNGAKERQYIYDLEIITAKQLYGYSPLDKQYIKITLYLPLVLLFFLISLFLLQPLQPIID